MQTLLAILLLIVLLVLLYTAQRHLYSVRARGQAPTKAEPTADAYAKPLGSTAPTDQAGTVSKDAEP